MKMLVLKLKLIFLGLNNERKVRLSPCQVSKQPMKNGFSFCWCFAMNPKGQSDTRSVRGVLVTKRTNRPRLAPALDL